jgi:hypothetical protein
VANAAATGTVSNVVYRFEWSEVDTFPADSRTGSRDNVAQGTSTTSYTITDSLKPNAKYFWRARASSGALTSDWSGAENFVTLNKGFVSGQYIYDPLTDGATVGSRVGGSFVPGQGWRADSDGIGYTIPTCSSCTVELDVTNFGRGQGASALKDYKWLSMGNGSMFDNFTAFRDHPWKMHLEQRGDGDGSGMKLVWRNGAVGDANPGDHTLQNDGHRQLAGQRGLPLHAALDSGRIHRVSGRDAARWWRGGRSGLVPGRLRRPAVRSTQSPHLTRHALALGDDARSDLAEREDHAHLRIGIRSPGSGARSSRPHSSSSAPGSSTSSFTRTRKRTASPPSTIRWS